MSNMNLKYFYKTNEGVITRRPDEDTQHIFNIKYNSIIDI